MTVRARFPRSLALRLAGVAFLFFRIAALAQTAPPPDDVINPDRPGIADGSATVGQGTLQIELGVQRDHTRDHQSDESDITTPALIRYGLTPRLELRVEGLGFTRAVTTVSGSRTSEEGWSPVSAGVKIHLLDAVDATHRPSVGVIVRLFVPSGSGAFRSSHAASDVRVAADMSLGERWAINPNVGIASADGGSGRFTSALAALTVQYNISKTINAFVDGALQSPEERGGGTSAVLDAGGAWVIRRDTQLDASIGWGVRGTTSPNVFVAAGISRRF